MKDAYQTIFRSQIYDQITAIDPLLRPYLTTELSNISIHVARRKEGVDKFQSVDGVSHRGQRSSFMYIVGVDNALILQQDRLGSNGIIRIVIDDCQLSRTYNT